jgi:hypothetical protein
MTEKEALKILGWTKAYQRHVERRIEIDRLGGSETLMDEITRRHRQGEKAAARVVLRRLHLSRR